MVPDQRGSGLKNGCSRLVSGRGHVFLRTALRHADVLRPIRHGFGRVGHKGKGISVRRLTLERNQGKHLELRMNAPNVLLTRDDLCDRWKLSKSSIVKLEKRGELRPIRLTLRNVRYSLAHILSIEATNSDSE